MRSMVYKNNSHLLSIFVQVKHDLSLSSVSPHTYLTAHEFSLCGPQIAHSILILMFTN